jgi:hypothetical protein
LLSSLVALSAQVSAVETLSLGSLEAAKSYDYCMWAHDDKADASHLPDVSAYNVDDKSAVNLENLPSAIVIDAGKRVAMGSPDRRACRKAFSEGRRLVSSIRKLSAKQLRKQAEFKKSEREDIAAIQNEITVLWMEDQLARTTYVQTQTSSKTDARHLAHLFATADTLAIDDKSSRYLRELLSEVEWIDIHRFTRPVSQTAMITSTYRDLHPVQRDLEQMSRQTCVSSGGN